MTGTDEGSFDQRLAALEAFVAALQAGQLEVGEAMRAYRERWRPVIAELEAELDAFRQELAGDDGTDGTDPAAAE